ncbi:hypothetical protein ACFL3S_04760 [Gemmatimonadota bacterium]
MTRTMRWVLLPLIVALLVSCEPPNRPVATAERDRTIDQRSYTLGGIGAFAEMVNAGVKKLALSAPLSPDEMDALMEEAERIVGSHDVDVFRETDFLVTDLFPADLTEGKHVLLICRGETRQEYLDLKAEKQRLIDSGMYDEAARLRVARRFGALLSYSEDKIEALLEAGRPSGS